MTPRSAAIYHIAERDVWHHADDTYAPSSLVADGFIHCSRWSQLSGVARAIFPGRTDLVVLEIDATHVAAPVVYEDLYAAGEEYPHVYGRLPRASVVSELALEWPHPEHPAFRRPDAPAQLVIRAMGSADVAAVAWLNSQLREDEGYEEELSLAALRDRLSGWLADGYEGWVFTMSSTGASTVEAAASASYQSAGRAAGIVAYALVRTGSDRDPIYLRQLFVRRGLRRAGVGRAAVNLILDRYGDGPMDVDALAANEPALRFWRAMGFADRSVSLRRMGGEVAESGEAGADLSLRRISGDTGQAEAFVLTGLKGFNDSVSPYHRAARATGAVNRLAVMLTDRTGRWLGGITGAVHWGWLEVKDFWIPERCRRAGWGKKILLEIERAGTELGATRAQLSTFSFQARGLYEKLGYRVVGELKDFPPGESFYWMRKDGLG